MELSQPFKSRLAKNLKLLKWQHKIKREFDLQKRFRDYWNWRLKFVTKHRDVAYKICRKIIQQLRELKAEN